MPTGRWPTVNRHDLAEQIMFEMSQCKISNSTSDFLFLVSYVSLCRPVMEMVQDIGEGNWLRFGAGKLRELCKLLPEESEVTTAPLFSCFWIYYKAKFSHKLYADIFFSLLEGKKLA